MTMNKIVAKTADMLTDGAITLTSATAGAVVFEYAVDHDVLNDQEASNIVGVVAGVGTYGLCKKSLKYLKYKTISIVNKATSTKKNNKKKKNK